MCRQYYLPCRHNTCPNFVKELHREHCPEPEGPECEVTYHKSRKWNRHPGGSHYCAACEEMGPEEWARRRAVIKSERAVEKRALEKNLREDRKEKERLENGQGRPGMKGKKPVPKKRDPPPPKPKGNSVRDPILEWWCGPREEPEWVTELFNTHLATSRAPRNPLPTVTKPLTSSRTDSSSDEESSSSSSEEG